MSNVKLFWMNEEQLEELRMDETLIGDEQKRQIEANLAVLFGLRFITGNYPMEHDVIDTLALDFNMQPVVLVYRSHPLQNPISRGLSAMAWLQKHQSEVRLLVLHHLGAEVAEKVQWQQPRLLCLSDFFNEAEISTASFTSVAIELLNCHYHGENLLSIERLPLPHLLGRHNPFQKQVEDCLEKATDKQQQLYKEFVALLHTQGDDLRVSYLDDQIIWTRLRDVARITFDEDSLQIRLNLPSEAVLIDEIGYDFVINNTDQEIEHGSVILHLSTSEELLLSSDLILRAYRFN